MILITSRRTMVVPSFTAEAIRLRLAKATDPSPDALLFTSRNGTPLTMANVRRQLRHVMDLAGIEGVTPHKLRGYYAWREPPFRWVVGQCSVLG